MMRILVAGGGTGGHFFSGVAVAEILKERGDELLFVGTPRGVEARVLPRLGWPLRFISVGGLKRVGLAHRLLSLAKLPIAFLQSLWILLRFRPDVVLGVGGYASGPIMMVAWLLRIPTVLIEQNSLPGITNRMLAHFVSAAVIHFERAASFFPPQKLRRYGNPIRSGIVQAAQQAASRNDDGRLHVLITGGSQGAHAINMALAESLPLLAQWKDRIVFRHQCGLADEAMLQEAYGNSGFEARLDAFIDDMVAAYRDADLVICRAGASTCAELAVVGRPALFVPLPSAADDHQTMNAAELVEAGGAWMIRQAEFTPERAASFLADCVANPDELARRAQAAKASGKADAARNTADLLYQLAGKTPPSSHGGRA